MSKLIRGQIICVVAGVLGAAHAYEVVNSGQPTSALPDAVDAHQEAAATAPVQVTNLTQGSPLTILISSPTGNQSRLVFSADDGWRFHPGGSADRADGILSPAVVATTSRALPNLEQPAIERPLTVFVDGPTGYTFIYVLNEGWRFVGRIAGAAR